MLYNSVVFSARGLRKKCQFFFKGLAEPLSLSCLVRRIKTHFCCAVFLAIACSGALLASDFHALIKAGDVKHVREQLNRHKIFVNMADDLGRSPLHLAVISGHLNIVNVLIKAGADVNAVDRLKSLSPLHYAAFHNFPKIMLFLLSRGALIDVQDTFGNRPLHFAAANGCRATVEILLNHHASPGVWNKDWQTPLHLVALAGTDRNRFFAASEKADDYLAVAKLLLDAGASANVFDAWQNRPETIAWRLAGSSDFPARFSALIKKHQKN